VLDESLSNVKLKGYVNKKNIPYILSKSSVNILNYSQSKYNWSRGNSSNKLFEYMASGKPIISTVKMGYSPIKRYNCGIELERDTPENLAIAIKQIYELSIDEYTKLGKRARSSAQEFDYKLLSAKMIKLLKEI